MMVDRGQWAGSSTTLFKSVLVVSLSAKRSSSQGWHYGVPTGSCGDMLAEMIVVNRKIMVVAE